VNPQQPPGRQRDVLSTDPTGGADAGWWTVRLSLDPEDSNRGAQLVGMKRSPVFCRERAGLLGRLGGPRAIPLAWLLLTRQTGAGWRGAGGMQLRRHLWMLHRQLGFRDGAVRCQRPTIHKEFDADLVLISPRTISFRSSMSAFEAAAGAEPRRFRGGRGINAVNWN